MIINSDYKSSLQINEDIRITQSAKVSLRGICNGKIILSDMCNLNIYGIHSGEIHVSEYCECTIHGTHIGNITNLGTLHIYGIVKDCHITGNEAIIHDHESET